MSDRVQQTVQQLEVMVEDLSLEEDITESEQLEVLAEAFSKFLERNGKYKDLWRQFGYQDSVHHVRSKAGRLNQLLSEQPTSDELDLAIDDAIDIINYAVFFIRNVREADRAQ